ncbi:MAG: hypothetical protein M3441_26775 [Chloroflexota bacterium]|nr:hypothetical protein [Chloroflexota bacterium]MDQ5853017.1 hypothetical protein [Chloroflexota bacterium]
MNDEQGFRDQVGKRGIADDSFAAHQAGGQGRWVETLKHRWPTALGVALAALAVFDLEVDAESVSSLSALTVLMALVYLGAAALDRRRAAWVVFLAAVAVLIAGRLLDSSVGASVVFLVSALVFLVLGVVRGQLRKGGGLPLQTIGMLGFGAIGLLALYVTPTLGGYLVAAALIGHAAWDAIHFRLHRVVSRSYAEFCAVVDLLLGVAILFLLAMR